MKAHFVLADFSFGKVPDRMKNMWHTEFGKRYRWDPMHEHAIRDAWQRWASLQYKDLMYKVHTDGYQSDWMSTAQYMSLCDEWGYKNRREVGRYTIGPILGEELKANTERLHIETGSPISINKQLMLDAAGGNNRDNVYGFGSQFAAVTAERQRGSGSSMSSIPSVSSAAGHEACIKKERRF
ncbi:hypothetical protein M9H77_27933 [Catharanthus roseus]|uniref:Uncharacterized protein n=1 Tax=Catharanthus roseus TaxID=4058 RepID=A0ACC0AE48_CATRO|nr:hypothetical protein M9H77_27933 [Catharanthus roseus]